MRSAGGQRLEGVVHRGQAGLGRAAFSPGRPRFQAARAAADGAVAQGTTAPPPSHAVKRKLDLTGPGRN
jgi:hypothetical protein